MRLVLAVLFIFITLSPAQALPKYSELYGLLIDLQGWEAEKPTGSNMSSPMGDMVTAERTYRKDRAELHAQFVGGSTALAYFMPFATGITYEDPEQLYKTITIEGFPSGVNYNKKEHSGVVVVRLSSDQAPTPAVFVLNYSNISYEEAVEIARRFPLKRASKLIE